MTDKRESAARAMFAVLNPGEDWDVWVKMDNPGIRSAVNHAVKLGDRLLASGWLAEHDREVADRAVANAKLHLAAAMTGPRSTDEATWPGYWEAKQHALDELTGLRALSDDAAPAARDV